MADAAAAPPPAFVVVSEIGYFLSPAAAPYLTQLTAAEVADLQHFEGNAAGFRILTHTYAAHSTGTAGLGITYATLGAFTKYPKPSLVAEPAKVGGASEKKYGHFQTESARFQHVATELGLLPKDAEAGFYHRHPLPPTHSLYMSQSQNPNPNLWWTRRAERSLPPRSRS